MTVAEGVVWFVGMFFFGALIASIVRVVKAFVSGG